MKKSKLELWLIVESKFDEYFEYGICNVIFKCQKNGFLTIKERDEVYNELRAYGIRRWGSQVGDAEESAFWENGLAKPRKKLIQKFIMKHIRDFPPAFNWDRSSLELWRVVKFNFNSIFNMTSHKYNTKGICGVLGVLDRNGIISTREYYRLIEELEEWGKANEMPAKFYYWEKGDPKPRLEWIDKQIQKHIDGTKVKAGNMGVGF